MTTQDSERKAIINAAPNDNGLNTVLSQEATTRSGHAAPEWFGMKLSRAQGAIASALSEIATVVG